MIFYKACYPIEATLLRISRTSSACLETLVFAKIDFSCALAVCWDMFWVCETSARLWPLDSRIARLASAGVRLKRSPRICCDADSLRSGSLINNVAQGLDWPSPHSD